MDGFELLRAAMVNRAVNDYKIALKKDDKQKISYLERWFLSQWGQLLSYKNGVYIITECKRLCGK